MNAHAEIKEPSFTRIGGARYYDNLEQGTDEWLGMRLGLMTASEIGNVLTKTLKPSNSQDTKLHLYDLVGQRITRHIEPSFMSFAMEQGHLAEVDARIAYENEYGRVTECGFIIHDAWGFDWGFSPDGLVGDNGQIEIKSRMPKFQVKAILEHIAPPEPDAPMPLGDIIQVQAGLAATGRDWCDYITYSNGLNFAVMRVLPIPEYQLAIKSALTESEDRMREMMAEYDRVTAPNASRIHPVPRIDYSDEISL